MPVEDGVGGDEEEDMYTLRFGSFLQDMDEAAFRDAATFGTFLKHLYALFISPFICKTSTQHALNEEQMRIVRRHNWAVLLQQEMP